MTSETNPKERATLQVKILPRSSKNQIMGFEGKILKIKLTAPPVNGEANKTLRNFLAKTLGISKGSIEIISGARSRTKMITIRGLSSAGVHMALRSISC